MKKKTYLITGGSGFIGSALVRRLLKEGYRVKALDNYLRGIPARLKDIRDSIKLIRADVRDAGAVRRACKGADAVCHLAYLNGTEFFYKRPELVLDIGVKGMVNVIDSCVLEKVSELTLLSSSEVYQTPPAIPTAENAPLSVPDPLNPRYSYGGGKIISELMALNYGRKHFKRVIIVRPHNVYGPNMGQEHVIPQFLARMRKMCRNSKKKSVRFPIQGTGAETRAFVFIDDFIDGFMLALKNGEHMGIYNIGSTEEIPIGRVARETGAYFGKRVILVSREAPPGGTPRRCPDITKIKKLGYEPKVSFKDGFRITARWYTSGANKPTGKAERKVGHEKIRPLFA